MSPVAAGALVAVVLIALVAALFVALDRPFVESGGVSSEFWVASIVCWLIGYTMAAGRYLNLAIARDLVDAGRMHPEALEPENEAWIFGSSRQVVSRSRVAGLVGAVGILVVLQWAGDPLVDAAGRLDPRFVWSVPLTPLLLFLMIRAGYFTASGTRDRANDGLRIPAGEIDLLDMHSHLVEGRVGLRLALVWIVGSTIGSLMFFDRNVAQAIVPLVLASVAVGVFALMMPVRRLHNRIRDAKARELARVGAELSAARDDAIGGDGADGRLADLLAYRAYLEDVREWPFDNSTVARFFLYMLIPLGGWLGGALVERLVERVLG